MKGGGEVFERRIRNGRGSYRGDEMGERNNIRRHRLLYPAFQQMMKTTLPQFFFFMQVGSIKDRELG